MSRPTRVAALYLAIVFLAGTLFGVVVDRFYSQRTARAASSPSPKESRERYVTTLQKELALTAAQLAQVTEILDQTGQRFRELRERSGPEFEAIREDQRRRIMGVLTVEQQPKYRKILEEHRQRRQRPR